MIWSLTFHLILVGVHSLLADKSLVAKNTCCRSYSLHHMTCLSLRNLPTRNIVYLKPIKLCEEDYSLLEGT